MLAPRTDDEGYYSRSQIDASQVWIAESPSLNSGFTPDPSVLTMEFARDTAGSPDNLTDLLLNGVSLGTAGNNNTPFTGDSAELPQIGYGTPGGSNINRRFIGELAEILIYDRMLNPAELNAVGFYLDQKYQIDTAFIPEPSTVLLLLAGLAWLITGRHRAVRRHL